MSVKDFVSITTKKTQDFGIEGYSVAKTHNTTNVPYYAAYDHSKGTAIVPTDFFLSKFLEKDENKENQIPLKKFSAVKKCFLDDYIKTTAGNPPADYKVELEWIQKHRVSSHYKSDRKTECAEIEDTIRKNKKPCPTKYDPDDTFTRKRRSTCHTFKDERLGYIDEALLLGKQWPA